MRRTIPALAICAGITLTSTSLTAAAETPAHFRPGTTIVLYDRTTDPRATEAIDYAIGIWNGVGANFTLTYERGPGDNHCAPKPENEPNTIGICTYPSGSNGNYGRYPDYPLDGSGHVRNGYAGQCTDAPCAGLSEAKRILPHEIGHVLGLNHTGLDSTGACSIMSVECYSLVPNQLDRDILRGLYGHSHAPVVAGSTWFSDGTKLRQAPAGVETTIRAYATAAVPGAAYRLVSGRGTAAAPCATETVPANTALVYTGSSGVIGTVTGKVNRPAGDWQVCFLAVGNATATATAPIIYRAT